MADLFVDPGLNTIQPAINAANNVSGDRVILRDGTYTFNTNAMIFTSAVTGTLFTNLTVMAENPGLAILDFSGCPVDAIFPGNAQGVIISGGIVLTGTPIGGGVIRDHADSPMTGWTFDGLTLDAMTKPFFNRPVNPPGTSLAIKNIVTTANYGGAFVVLLVGPATDLDLLIAGIDARMHVAAGSSAAVRLQDVRDARVLDVLADDWGTYGVEVRTTDAAKGVRDVRIARSLINRAGSVGIHIGHTADQTYPLAEAHNVQIHDCECHDTVDGYGFEFENGVHNSEMIGCTVVNPTRFAYPLAEDCWEDKIEGCLAIAGPGTSPTDGTGVVFSNGRKHIVVHNTFVGFRSGINVQRGVGYQVATERNTCQDNIFANCGEAYRINTTNGAMPAGAIAHMLGRNVVHFTASYARVDDVEKTQTETEALFPDHFDESDTVVASMDDIAFVDATADDYRTYDSSPAEALRAGFYRGGRPLPALANAPDVPGRTVRVFNRDGSNFIKRGYFDDETPRPMRVEVANDDGSLDTSFANLLLTGKLSVDEAIEVDVPCINNNDGTYDIIWPAAPFALGTSKRYATARFDTLRSNGEYGPRFAFPIRKRV